MSLLDDEDDEWEEEPFDNEETVCDSCGVITYDGMTFGSQYLCDSCYTNELNYND